MDLLHQRRRKHKPAEEKQKITVLHVAATITLVALTVAMFLYYSPYNKFRSPGLPIKIESKSVQTFEESPESLKQKKVIKPEGKNDE